MGNGDAAHDFGAVFPHLGFVVFDDMRIGVPRYTTILVAILVLSTISGIEALLIKTKLVTATPLKSRHLLAVPVPLLDLSRVHLAQKAVTVLLLLKVLLWNRIGKLLS